MLKILMTGTGGYLGTKLFQKWFLLGHEILPFKSIKKDKFKETVYKSFEDIIAFKPDIAVHLAGSYGRNNESIVEVLDANYRFGLEIIEYIIKHTKKRIDFINIGTALPRKLSHYAMTKSSFRDHGIIISEANPELINFVTLQLQHFYGPGCQKDNFIMKIINECFSHRNNIKITAGYQRRDFIYIDDVVSAIDLLVKNRDRLERQEIIDIGTSRAYSIRETVELIKMLTGSTVSFDYGSIPMRCHEPELCVANLSRLNSFGWKPLYSLKSGVEATIESQYN